MVDRLEARLESNPRDHEGWIRLARSRLVLGDRQAARWALARAMEIFADAPAMRAEIETAARELDLDAPSGR
jgi:cytochrome c-type biogenesis protein CcmH